MKKQTRRSERVADLVRAEISRLVLMEAHDPELRKVTITDVQMPADLRSARIYFSALGGDEERDRALEALDRAASFLRREVGRRCQLRFVPELHFFADRSIERGARIEELLAEYVAPAEGAPASAEPEAQAQGDEELADSDDAAGNDGTPDGRSRKPEDEAP
jgi:ribosome-binding factor A